MSKLLFIAVLVGLTGCQPSTSVKTDLEVPYELKDCKFFDMYDGFRNLVVARCPNSSTSIRTLQSCGKGCTKEVFTSTIEETYE